MSESPSLKQTIIGMLKRDRVPSMEASSVNTDNEESATAGDRAYLASWLEGDVDDPIWSKILAAAQKYCSYRLSYTWLVRIVLRAKRQAESVRFGDDPILELRQKKRQELLELAAKAQALADYYRQEKDQNVVSCYVDYLRPVGELSRRQQLEANMFRQRAGEEPAPTVAPIRQDRRRGRTGLRQRRAFIRLIFTELEYAIWGEIPIDFTHVEAATALARIAFPEVDAEVVRKTLEPTTREGRRHKRAAGASGPTAPAQASQSGDRD
jgi:hypothetical protein